MRKALILLLCLTFVIFSGCGEVDTNSHPDIVVNLPDGEVINGQQELPDSIDGNKVTIAEPDKIVDYYVGSSTTKKFHLKDCQWAQKMKDENKVYLSGYNEFIKQGYTPCKSCNP